jgi:hypothetical protein
MEADEITNVSATTQLAVLVRGIEMELNITEELSAFMSVRETNCECIFV